MLSSSFLVSVSRHEDNISRLQRDVLFATLLCLLIVEWNAHLLLILGTSNINRVSLRGQCQTPGRCQHLKNGPATFQRIPPLFGNLPNQKDFTREFRAQAGWLTNIGLSGSKQLRACHPLVAERGEGVADPSFRIIFHSSHT